MKLTHQLLIPIWRKNEVSNSKFCLMENSCVLYMSVILLRHQFKFRFHFKNKSLVTARFTDMATLCLSGATGLERPPTKWACPAPPAPPATGAPAATTCASLPSRQTTCTGSNKHRSPFGKQADNLQNHKDIVFNPVRICTTVVDHTIFVYMGLFKDTNIPFFWRQQTI